MLRLIQRSVPTKAGFRKHEKVFLQQKRLYSSNKPKSSGGGGLLWVTVGTVTLVGGATLAYAKYDPSFRKTLNDYVPITDSVIKVLWQEEDTLGNVSKYFSELSYSILSTVGLGSKKSIESSEPKKTYKAPSPVAPASSDKNESFSELRIESKDKGRQEPSVKIIGGPKVKDECDESIRDLETKLCNAATEAVNSYNRAITILKTYNRDIENLIDDAVNEIKPELWDSVKQKTRSKNECIRRAKERADEAIQTVNKLKEHISRGDSKIVESAKQVIRGNIVKVQEDIASAKKSLDLELKRGNVTEKYWDKVEKARAHFSENLEILFPSIDISKKKLNISEEDLDLFVLHTYATILFYQKELAKMETVIQEKVRSAVETAKLGGGEALTNAQICEAIEQERRKLAVHFQKQCLKLRKESEIELREQLKHQSQAFSDHLNDAIKTKELEIERCLAKKFDEKLESENNRFKMQLAAMVGRLRGLDEALKAKADADENTKRSQILWSACQSLLRAIRAGCPGIPWKDQIRPLSPEINAVRDAAGKKDELVCVVLESIPQEARERGVYPEDALRERFLKVEEVARNVALVPEEGAALPIHILSFLQAQLLFKSVLPIPQAELNDEPVDFSSLNTHDILQRARYWLDRGDFEQTLKYMNLLQGAPRSVARQWMVETRILLETQQAANTLMAHAASSGLTYL